MEYTLVGWKETGNFESQHKQTPMHKNMLTFNIIMKGRHWVERLAHRGRNGWGVIW